MSNTIIVSEVIQRTKSLEGRGTSSQSSRLTDRHIYSAAITARATLVRQQANKHQKISSWCYQFLEGVELVLSSISNLPEAPKNCTVLRTKYRLPSLISDLSCELIKSVSSGDTNFDVEESDAVKYAGGNKYTAFKPMFYLRDGYGYVTVLKMRKSLDIEALFEDPIQVFRFPTLIDCNCACTSNLDVDFHVDRNLITPLLQLTNQELIVMFSQVREDRNSDGQDDTGTIGNMVHQNQNQDNGEG